MSRGPLTNGYVVELPHLRERFGGDKHAINKHSIRIYEDQRGRRWYLDKTLDGVPPFYSVSGPWTPGTKTFAPHLKVMGENYWGSGLGWTSAVHRFFFAVGEFLKAEEAAAQPPTTKEG